MRPTQNGLDFLRQMAAHALSSTSPVALIDVGASRGIHRRWAALGDRFAAIGFDPLIAEVERLNAVETRPHVRYEAALVGCRDYDRLFPPELRADEITSLHNEPYVRSSAAAAHAIRQQDYVRERFNAGAQVRYTERFITLDEYFASSHLRPNFLKVDTDGHDLEVLIGAAGLLGSPDLLGVQVEAPFHGAVHPYANGFSNIDRHLREHGFSLFDLAAFRYSRAALPAPFAYGVLAQTVSGQVHWGDALYFRDLAHPSYGRMFGIDATRERALKLAALFAVYGLDDCAAELLVSAPALAELPARARLLDALTPRYFGDLEYSEYMSRFAADPAAWLPRDGVSLDQPDGVSVASQGGAARHERLHVTIREMRERIVGLKKVQRKLRRLLDEREAKIRRMREERMHRKATSS